MMSALHLPSELWINVVNFLLVNERHCSKAKALTETSKTLHQAVNHVLYDTIQLSGNEKSKALIRTLNANPQLLDSVRNLSLFDSSFRATGVDDGQTLYTLRRLKNLRTVHLQNIGPHSALPDFSQNPLLQSISIRQLQYLAQPNDIQFANLPNLTQLSLDDDYHSDVPAYKTLLSLPTLRTLGISYNILGMISQVLTPAGVDFSRVENLGINVAGPTIPKDMLPLLAPFTGTSRIHLSVSDRCLSDDDETYKEQEDPSVVHAPLPSDAIPIIQEYRGSPLMLEHLMPLRPSIKAVDLSFRRRRPRWENAFNSQLVPNHLDRLTLLNVRWDSDLLENVAHRCPDLTHLGICCEAIPQEWFTDSLCDEIHPLRKLQVLIIVKGTASHDIGDIYTNDSCCDIPLDEQRAIIHRLHAGAPDLREVRIDHLVKWNFLGPVDGWNPTTGVRAKATLLSA